MCDLWWTSGTDVSFSPHRFHSCIIQGQYNVLQYQGGLGLTPPQELIKKSWNTFLWQCRFPVLCVGMLVGYMLATCACGCCFTCQHMYSSCVPGNEGFDLHKGFHHCIVTYIWRLCVVLNILKHKLIRSVLFWDITQRHVVIVYRRFGTTYLSHLHGSRVRPRRAQISSTSRQKPEIRTSYLDQ